MHLQDPISVTYNPSVSNSTVVCDEVEMYWPQGIFHHAGPVLRSTAVLLAQEPPIWGTVPAVHVGQQQMGWVSDISVVCLCVKQ